MTASNATEIEFDPGAAYATKTTGYFAGARSDIVDRLPVDPGAAILEVGCGSGDTGVLALERRRAGRYVGIELMPGPAAIARERLSDVIVGDIETLDLPFRAAEFDAAILSEVLEHLREPEAVVARLARHVRPGGRVFASSPNVAHWKVIGELLAGRFPAEDRGVFDRTHLRWFTPQSYAAMFQRCGFEVYSIGPVRRFSARQRLIDRLTGGRFRHLLMTQVMIEGVRR